MKIRVFSEINFIVLFNCGADVSACSLKRTSPGGKGLYGPAPWEVYDYTEKVNAGQPEFKRIRNIYIRSEAEGGRIK